MISSFAQKQAAQVVLQYQALHEAVVAALFAVPNQDFNETFTEVYSKRYEKLESLKLAELDFAH